MGNGICSVEDCQRVTHARGYCSSHYDYLRRHGTPKLTLGDYLAKIGWTVTERGCWEWNGHRKDSGYGIFTARRLGIMYARAHRVVYEHLVGPIPDDLVLRHRCDNPPCVNPEHLEPGTKADNSRDMVERRRHWRHDRTECDNGHDLTRPGAKRVVKRKRGVESICVECARERSQRYARRKRTDPKASDSHHTARSLFIAHGGNPRDVV